MFLCINSGQLLYVVVCVYVDRNYDSCISAQGHMLRSTLGTDRSIILVAYLSFPNDCEFVVVRMHDGGGGAVKFSQICQIFGPQVISKYQVQLQSHHSYIFNSVLTYYVNISA